MHNPLNHKHILVTAYGLRNPPSRPDTMSQWLIDLVALVDMQVLMGPYSLRCEDLGNEGVTGVIVITTSHASVHCWDTDTVPFLKMDLYSCRDFDPQDVVRHMGVFAPTSVEFMVIDRNAGMHVLETTTVQFDDQLALPLSLPPIG